jgi:hypothetical protein
MQKVHFSNSFIRPPTKLVSSNIKRKKIETWDALRLEEPALNRKVRKTISGSGPLKQELFDMISF